MLGKKGQISEIMTWIVATLIILVILIVFIYASSILAQKTKVMKAKDFKIDLGKNVDFLETKTLIAYSSASSSSDKEIIDKWRDKKNDEE